MQIMINPLKSIERAACGDANALSFAECIAQDLVHGLCGQLQERKRHIHDLLAEPVVTSRDGIILVDNYRLVEGVGKISCSSVGTLGQ